MEQTFQEWVKSKEEVFYRFLLENEKERFPFVCTLASEILFSYAKQHFPNIECMLGDFIVNWEYVERWDMEEEEGALHCWIKDNDTIVDFTLFQFNLKWEDGLEDELLDWAEAFLKGECTFKKWKWVCVEPYQKDILIHSDNPAYHWYIPYETLKPRFESLAKGRTFEEYLELLASYKQGSYNPDKKREKLLLEAYSCYDYAKRKGSKLKR